MTDRRLADGRKLGEYVLLGWLNGVPTFVDPKGRKDQPVEVWIRDVEPAGDDS